MGWTRRRIRKRISNPCSFSGNHVALQFENATQAQEWREPGYLQSLGGAVLPNAFPRRDAAPLGRLAGGTPPADAPRPPGDPGGPPMGATPLGMPPAAAAAFAAAAAYGGPQGIGGGLGVGMDLGPGGAGVGAYDGMIWGGARTTPQPTVPEVRAGARCRTCAGLESVLFFWS